MPPILRQPSIKDLTPSNYTLPCATYERMQKGTVKIKVEPASIKDPSPNYALPRVTHEKMQKGVMPIKVETILTKDLTPLNYAPPHVAYEKGVVLTKVESAPSQVIQELEPPSKIDIIKTHMTSTEKLQSQQSTRNLTLRTRPGGGPPVKPKIEKIVNPPSSTPTNGTRVDRGVSNGRIRNDKKGSRPICSLPNADITPRIPEIVMLQGSEPNKTLMTETPDARSTSGSTPPEKGGKHKTQSKRSSKKKSRVRSFPNSNFIPLAIRNRPPLKETTTPDELGKQKTSVVQSSTSSPKGGNEDLDKLFKGTTYYSISTAMQSIDVMQDTRIIWNSFQEQWAPFWLKRPCVLLRDFSRVHKLHDPVYSLRIENNNSYCCWVENDAIDYVSIQAFEILYIEVSEISGRDIGYPADRRAQCKHDAVIDNGGCPTSGINDTDDLNPHEAFD
ncbi:13637_t:CDS:2 [Acaulospora colombiana]|uniref:13637_t:CDS:1 n=1 Tax=Acaulospora colombiana TaxID=27376 RepID=A0ACA9LLT1_9GLOM|nr:13637_t:CDS:2 [Acaulospora colombiana]